MSPGFQYDAPWMVRASDPNYLRAVLLWNARDAESFGKPSLAARLRQDANSFKGDDLFRAALSARHEARA